MNSSKFSPIYMVADSGDTKNEFIVLEYEEIKQQIYFEYTEGDKSYFNLLKASKFAQLALEARSLSYARYESVDVVTPVLLRPIVQSLTYVMRRRGLNKFASCHMSLGSMNTT